jgi:hypothetical protein
MEHGKEIFDLELMDRIDLHDLTAVCALRGLLRVLAGRFQCSITSLFPPLHGLSPCRARGQTTLQWPTPRLLDIEIESGNARRGEESTLGDRRVPVLPFHLLAICTAQVACYRFDPCPLYPQKQTFELRSTGK